MPVPDNVGHRPLPTASLRSFKPEAEVRRAPNKRPPSLFLLPPPQTPPRYPQPRWASPARNPPAPASSLPPRKCQSGVNRGSIALYSSLYPVEPPAALKRQCTTTPTRLSTTPMSWRLANPLPPVKSGADSMHAHNTLFLYLRRRPEPVLYDSWLSTLLFCPISVPLPHPAFRP
ncbi:hypothetical protein DFH08DRAFT_1044258 [Mycena albidolilacea]|uniref:Uncharacterized protein n=1 Tax=Mycena albidolilacea TaxID=1033008 RepID=A0AAD6Z991_9AGAR|nr:hypothetical protein DFH08DRAFT_1044258 [Mycena albidolilacea]